MWVLKAMSEQTRWRNKERTKNQNSRSSQKGGSNRHGKREDGQDGSRYGNGKSYKMELQGTLQLLTLPHRERKDREMEALARSARRSGM